MGLKTEQESLGLGVAVGRGNRVLRVQVASAVPCRTHPHSPGSTVHISISRATSRPRSLGAPL